MTPYEQGLFLFLGLPLAGGVAVLFIRWAERKTGDGR